jgi:hypothetical protein
MKTQKDLNLLNLIKNSLLLIALAAFLMGPAGCKSKKPPIDDPKDDTEQVNAELVKAKSTLTALLSDDCTKTVEEKEKILADIKALNLDDPELNELIKKVEEDIAKEKEAIRIAEEKAKEAAKPENRLRKYFDGIAKASSEAEANQLIEETLQMFTSDQCNVLIIIAEQGAIKDYDEPTKIRKYLNYLKDTKNNVNDIDEIKFEGEKVKTLILRKKK